MPGAFACSDPPTASLTLAAITIAIGLVPSLQRALVLDRHLVAAGEWWRVATGSLVHFSMSHLGYDLGVVFVAGTLIERCGRRLLPVLVTSSVVVGASVLVFAPEITLYGGLSGVAYTLVVVLALDGLAHSALTRATAVATLLLVVAKAWWELASGRFLLVHAADAVQPVSVAHVAGAVVGALWFFLARMQRFSRPRCR